MGSRVPQQFTPRRDCKTSLHRQRQCLGGRRAKRDSDNMVITFGRGSVQQWYCCYKHDNVCIPGSVSTDERYKPTDERYNGNTVPHWYRIEQPTRLCKHDRRHHNLHIDFYLHTTSTRPKRKPYDRLGANVQGVIVKALELCRPPPLPLLQTFIISCTELFNIGRLNLHRLQILLPRHMFLFLSIEAHNQARPRSFRLLKSWGC